MKRKQYHGKPGTKLIKFIRQYFPKVEAVVDAKASALVEVTKEDSQGGTVKDPALCAFARACYRSFKADGVIIGLTTMYIIRAKVATRYKNTESVSREIISFDRKAGFYPGIYMVTPYSPRQQLGVYKGRPTHPKSKNGQDRRRFRHFTAGVRVLNMSEETRE